MKYKDIFAKNIRQTLIRLEKNDNRFFSLFAGYQMINDRFELNAKVFDQSSREKIRLENVIALNYDDKSRVVRTYETICSVHCGVDFN